MNIASIGQRPIVSMDSASVAFAGRRRGRLAQPGVASAQ